MPWDMSQRTGMIEERAQRRLAAILAADVVGYKAGSELKAPYVLTNNNNQPVLGRQRIKAGSPCHPPLLKTARNPVLGSN